MMILAAPIPLAAAEPLGAGLAPTTATLAPEGLTLAECLESARENNRLRPISRAALEMAEAQYHQALSGYWPTLKLLGGYTLMDENATFQYPNMPVSIPKMQVPISGQSIALPANALGPGFPATAIAVPIPDSTFNVPAQKFDVPGQKVDILGRQTASAELRLEYPIYTGGKVSAIVRQAEAGVDSAREEVRRTDLQVTYDVRRMYYAAVMARNLVRIAEDAHARLKVTLDLTENLYKTGTGTAKRTDYLRNRMTVEGVEAMLATLRANEKMARAALVATMGLPWDSDVAVAMDRIPLDGALPDTAAEVASAYTFNPDWNALEAGLRAAEAQVDEARSGHKPKVMLTGSLRQMQNSMDGGLNTADNRNSWQVGVGFEIPIFSGFRTVNQVREAKARVEKMRQQQFLLRDALGVQVRALVDQIAGSAGQAAASGRAAATATENRDLNMRGYQAGLIETKDVIEAQLTESFMQAQQEKALFDHAQAEAMLNCLVGSEVERQLAGTTPEEANR